MFLPIDPHGVRCPIVLGRARVRMTLARLLQALVLLLLLWAALWLAGAVYWGAAWWLVAIAWLLVFAHVLVMALEFALQAWFNRSDPAPRATARRAAARLGRRSPSARWRCSAGACPFARAVLPTSSATAWRRRDAQGRRGVILVHGFVCNRGIWNPGCGACTTLGVPCIALNLEPLFGSIDRYAPLIEDAVRRLTQATGRAPLLVAHSMGGLAVRAWLRDFDGDARMHGVVTVGSPHRGTWLARFGHAPNAREMRLDGPWLRALAAAEPPERYRRFTCFYSHCDNIVLPCSAATLPGADNRHLRGHGPCAPAAAPGGVRRSAAPASGRRGASAGRELALAGQAPTPASISRPGRAPRHRPA